MLLINASQMLQLSEALEGRYVRQCNAMLRMDFPEFAEQQEEVHLSDFVRRSIKAARKYKILNREDVKNFIRYQAAFGEGFEEKEGFENLKKVLLTRNFSGTEKIKRMLEKKKPEKPN